MLKGMREQGWQLEIEVGRFRGEMEVGDGGEMVGRNGKEEEWDR